MCLTNVDSSTTDSQLTAENIVVVACGFMSLKARCCDVTADQRRDSPDRKMDWVTSRRAITVGSRFQSQTWTYRSTFGFDEVERKRFAPGTSVFACQYHSVNASCWFIHHRYYIIQEVERFGKLFT
jgi:hypothetical protein